MTNISYRIIIETYIQEEYMKINEKLPILRKRCGMSQEDLANELNVSRQSVYKWETGEANPDITKLQKMAKALGVSFDYLLDENIDITKVDDVPADKPTEVKRRKVFCSGRDLQENQAALDNGFVGKANTGIFSKREVVANSEEIFQENFKKMTDYFEAKGYEYIQLQDHLCAAFFVDNKEKLFGFWFAGAVQFVCPIENFISFRVKENQPTGPVANLGFPFSYDIDVSYFTEDGKDLSYYLTIEAFHPYWQYEKKNLTKEDIDATFLMRSASTQKAIELIAKKITMLKTFVDKIERGACKVNEVDTVAFSKELSDAADAAITNRLINEERIKTANQEAKKADRKELLKKILIGVGIAAAVVVAFLIYNSLGLV